jgi:Glycine zipper 2TM domain
MRKSILFSTIAAIALIPSVASAQSSCERQRSGRIIGTVAGAGVGGVLGNVIAGKGDKTLGTIIGAVGGGIIGNQIAKPSQDCSRAFGYYDKQNRWHATGIATSSAIGYYNRDGDWVDGAPNGYYDDSNRWRQNPGTQSDNGGYGPEGHWVPASANGYYDKNDVWIAGSSSGYYDDRGRWVSGTTTGHYDRSGRWMAGVASGRNDANGNWIADAQSGHYGSDGRWTTVSGTGYYDTRGRWVSTGPIPDPQAQDTRRNDSYGYYDNQGMWHAAMIERGRATGYYDRNNQWVAGAPNGYYDNRGRWIATSATIDQGVAPREVRARAAWLDQYIRTANSQGTLSRVETNRAQRDLNAIRASERSMVRNRNGELSIRNEAAIQARLDRLSDRLRITRG